MIADEGNIVAAEGMLYVHIPVDWQQPKLRDVLSFFDVMRMLSGRKVWVHCAKNMRASCFMYLYRTYVLGIPDEEAAAPMLAIWNPDDYPAWKRLTEESKEHFQYLSSRTCEGMETIRKGIDTLDREIVSLLGRRAQYVHRAAEFKSDAKAVHAVERQESMLKKRREWAEEEGLEAEMVEEMYRNLIKHFIGQEMKTWEEK